MHRYRRQARSHIWAVFSQLLIGVAWNAVKTVGAGLPAKAVYQ